MPPNVFFLSQMAFLSIEPTARKLTRALAVPWWSWHMKINWYKKVKVKGNWLKTNREVGGDNETGEQEGKGKRFLVSEGLTHWKGPEHKKQFDSYPREKQSLKNCFFLAWRQVFNDASFIKQPLFFLACSFHFPSSYEDTGIITVLATHSCSGHSLCLELREYYSVTTESSRSPVRQEQQEMAGVKSEQRTVPTSLPTHFCSRISGSTVVPRDVFVLLSFTRALPDTFNNSSIGSG